MAKKSKVQKQQKAPAPLKKRSHDSGDDVSDTENLVQELDEDFDEVAQLLGENVQDPEDKKKAIKDQKKLEKLQKQSEAQDAAIRPAVVAPEVLKDADDTTTTNSRKQAFLGPPWLLSAKWDFPR